MRMVLLDAMARPWTLGTFFFVLGAAASAAGLDVKVTPNAAKIAPYDIFELAFQHANAYADPAWDVTIDVAFASPSGKKASVGGFFYGSSRPQEPIIQEVPTGRGGTRRTATWRADPADLWKARYAPSEAGEWTYRYVFRDKTGDTAEGAGEFEVVQTDPRPKGWVRINPRNCFRFVFEDGEPFYPVGLQNGFADTTCAGTLLATMPREGPFRLDRDYPLPPGPLFLRGPHRTQTGQEYFRRQTAAGFNLFRFSPANNSPILFSDPRTRQATLGAVSWKDAQMFDELLLTARKNGMRVMYGIFGYNKVSNFDAGNTDAIAQVKRAIKYSVDRWGSCVDIWELLNEQDASDGWYDIMIPYLRSVDPYAKPITTSWDSLVRKRNHPELKARIEGLDIDAPHWYQNEPELLSDVVTVDHIRADKELGLPVIYGEQGNCLPASLRGAKGAALGLGGVWDPGSALRMRVRLWTALFNEAAIIFWETSYAKDGHYMNLWIGPDERRYVCALQRFSNCLDNSVRMTRVGLSGPQAAEVRGYALTSARCSAVYLYHGAFAASARESTPEQKAVHAWDHDRGQVRDLRLALANDADAKGCWYEPSTGRIISRFDAPRGPLTVTAPPFDVDLALLVTTAPAAPIEQGAIPPEKEDD